MKRLKIPKLALLTGCLLGIAGYSSAQAGTATFDLNTDPTVGTSKAKFVGAAAWLPTGGVNNSGFIKLTDATGQTAAVLFPDFDNGLIVASFTFECQIKLGDWYGNPPADGFSVNYARSNDPIIGLIDAGTDPGRGGRTDGWAGEFDNGGTAPNLPEEGTQTGIGIGFDTWGTGNAPVGGSNGPLDVRGISVRVDGKQKVQIAMPSVVFADGDNHDFANDATTLITGPFTCGPDPANKNVGDASCNGGSPPAIGTKLNWVPLKIQVAADGTLNLFWKGTQIVTNLQTGYFPSAGRIIFGASTGGAMEFAGVDDIKITTVPSTTALVGTVAELPDATGFTAHIGDSGASIVDVDPAKSGLVVKLGTNVLANSSLTITKTNSDIAITYILPNGALIISGSTNTITITAKDTTGTAIAGTRSFTAFKYSVIDPSFALSAADVTSAKKLPGFFAQIYALDRPSQDFPNSNAASEQALDGEWGANVADLAGGVYTDQTRLLPNLRDETSTIDYASGAVPGIPSLAGQYGSAGTDNFAMAFYTAIEFPKAGLYTLIVNSDDGFRTYVSTNELDRYQQGSVIVGEFNGGRGNADTMAIFSIPKPGLYPFRTTYEEGGGGYGVHWKSLNADGSQSILNDVTDANALVSYAFIEQQRAYITAIRPGDGLGIGLPTSIVSPTNVVSVTIGDGSLTKYVSGSAKMTFDGADVTSQLATSAAGTGKTTVTYNPGKMIEGSQHTVTVVYSESTTPVSSRTTTFRFQVTSPTPDDLPANSFWIEAEDFNYGGGKTQAAASVMPYLGGAYDSLGGTLGVDYSNNDKFDSKAYRDYTTADLSVSGKSVNIVDTTPNRYGNTRPGGVTMNVAYRIGWVDDGEWYDYTRTVPAGVYTAYAALSYGNYNNDSMRGRLSTVTAGAGTANQTLQDIGTFNQAGSGAWGRDSLVPMKNPSGGLAYYKATGNATTLRLTTGSGDFDWFVLVPVTNAPASIVSAPDNNGGRSVHRDYVYKWTISDFNTKVVATSIKLQFDGTDVTSGATITKTGDVTTVIYAGPLTSGLHSWTFSYADSASKTTTTSNSIMVNPYGTPGIFAIEAEDFDYAGGNSNPMAGTAGKNVNVMPYTGGAYTNLSAVLNVDYANNDGLDSKVYRNGGPIDNAGTHVNIADNMGGVLGSDRGSWIMTQNFKIGWTDSADWGNYTRAFPANTYEVWAALSHGDGLGSPDKLRGTLQLVTAGVGTTNQTLKQLGRFNGPSAGGWSNNELVPLTDTNNVKQTVTIAGTNTVRFTMDSGDFDYFLFVPTTSGPTGPQFGPVVRNSDGSITISWTGGGTLQSAPSVTGPWTDVTGATSPFKYSPPAGTKAIFARIKI